MDTETNDLISIIAVYVCMYVSGHNKIATGLLNS